MLLVTQKNHPKNKILNCEDFIFCQKSHFYKCIKNRKKKKSNTLWGIYLTYS